MRRLCFANRFSVLRSTARLFSCANLGHSVVGISQASTEETTTAPLSPSSILLVFATSCSCWTHCRAMCFSVDHIKDSESDDDFAVGNIWNPHLVIVGEFYIELRMQTFLSKYKLGKLDLNCHFALDLSCEALFNMQSCAWVFFTTHYTTASCSSKASMQTWTSSGTKICYALLTCGAPQKSFRIRWAIQSFHRTHQPTWLLHSMIRAADARHTWLSLSKSLVTSDQNIRDVQTEGLVPCSLESELPVVSRLPRPTTDAKLALMVQRAFQPLTSRASQCGCHAQHTPSRRTSADKLSPAVQHCVT